MTHPFETGLDRNDANHVPLSPLSFIRRTAMVYPDRPAIVHGDRVRTWGETYARVRRLASALRRRGLGTGDAVAIMAPNIPAFVEASFGIPLAGCVINALNVRLDAPAVRFNLVHGGARLVLVDAEFAQVVKDAVEGMETPPEIVDLDDPLFAGGERIGTIDYEALLAEGDPEHPFELPADEWQSLALNYTSGTTGDPKGVVYSHRGGYLNAVSNALDWDMPQFPVYLWTLPMFHCNGWCFPWTIAAKAGTNVCLRRVEGNAIIDAFERHGVTHLCGAPIVMSLIIDAANRRGYRATHKVRMMTAAAPPPAAVIGRMEALGIDVTHVYGLTEVYGPCVVSAWKPEWDGLSLDERARLKARQGVPYTLQEELIVADPVTGAPVPADGVTLGEIFIRGNITMKGYLKNPASTRKAFAGGWFHTGDLAVMHPDGYCEIKDRSKDIIISGGENISSIEVEDALYRHPAVAAAAVVARPDEKWGEHPCAFVELKEDAEATAEELIAWCRDHLAHYKAPRTIVFEPLPKTSTGKVQKFVLRERARAL